MAAKHFSDCKESSKRKSSRRFSDRSEAACWVHGAEPDWFHTQEAHALERIFGTCFPQWYIKSSPWIEITPGRFQTMRKLILRISIAQCAAYLRVPKARISAWESGKVPVPFAAFEALRLQSETNFYKMSHQVWDGWYIQQQTGALVSPDNGKIAVLPLEINNLMLTYSRLAVAEEKCASQARRIDQLEVDNARLRGGNKVRAVAAELETMRETITSLLGDLQTAEIHQFPIAEQPARAIAGA